MESFFKWVSISSRSTERAIILFSRKFELPYCDYLLLAIAKKVYLIDQITYILSAAIGRVLFERNF